jgi:Stress responsive A/B Barrel Domain
MIRHLVILHFRKDLHADYPALLERTKPMLEQIPGIVSFQIFPNDSRYIPKDVYSLGIEIMFEDRAALDCFMNHPKHYEANATFERYLADPPYMVLTHDVK